MTDFRGLYCALVTPYTKAGEVNYPALKKLVNHLLSQGAEGFYVCGSTAEAFLLSQEERMRILECVLGEAGGKSTVLAHVGNIGAKLSCELARHAEQAGADAISSVAPFYYKFDEDEICAYYNELADSTALPMFVYNFPSNSGFQLDARVLAKLLENERVIGVKHTSSDFYQLERMKSLRDDLVVLNGYDEMMLSGLVAGADGGVGTTYNCLYPQFRQIRDAYQNNDMDKARAGQHAVNNIIEAMIAAGVFQSTKVILESIGIECNGCRRPFHNLTTEQEAKMIRVYRDLIAK